MLVLQGKPGEVAWTVTHGGETLDLIVVQITLRAADGTVRHIPAGFLPYVQLGFDGPRSFNINRNRHRTESSDA